MNRIDRLSAILIWLQTKKYLPAREIAARYNVSLRTVYRDIRALEEGGVPIGAEPGCGYFLAEGYHLPPVMLTRAEAGALVLGAKFIEKYSDIGVITHHAAALDKIKTVLGGEDQEFIDKLDKQVAVLHNTPSSLDNSSASILMELQSFLANSKVLSITYYAGYKQETTRRRVEPLGLCFYGSNWHLLAYCQLRKDYRDFRVDRIQAVSQMGEFFNRSRHADLKELIKRIITPINLKPATIIFTSKAARSIEIQKYYYGYIHERELDKQGDGQVEMDFLVSDFDYLATWLLSFTDQATVKAPRRLAQVMSELVNRLYRHYNQK